MQQGAGEGEAVARVRVPVAVERAEPGRRQRLVLAQPRHVVFPQSLLDRRDKVGGRIGDAHEAIVPVGADDVADARRDDRFAGREVLGVLVGLMKRVVSLRANGRSAASHPAR